MFIRQLQDINLLRNSTANGGFLRLTGGVIQTAINYTTVANDYMVVATALDLVITIGSVSQNSGQWIIVKDGTGKCSRANPLRIDAQGGIGFDNNVNPQLFITSPNGAIAMFVDPVSNQIWSAPWNPVLDGTIATTTYPDSSAGGDAPAQFLLRRLPLGPTSPDTITIRLTSATMVPYITADQAASSATMNFSHRFFDGTNQLLVTPDTDTLTITNGTNTYFTPDGLLDPAQNYAAFSAFGQLRIHVEGNAVGSTPATFAIVNLDSRGILAGPIPNLTNTVVDRSDVFILLD